MDGKAARKAVTELVKKKDWRAAREAAQAALAGGAGADAQLLVFFHNVAGYSSAELGEVGVGGVCARVGSGSGAAACACRWKMRFEATTRRWLRRRASRRRRRAC